MRPSELEDLHSRMSTEVLNVYDEAHDKNLCKAYDLRGFISLRAKNYFEADKDYNMAIQLCREFLEEMLPDDDAYE